MFFIDGFAQLNIAKPAPVKPNSLHNVTLLKMVTKDNLAVPGSLNCAKAIAHDPTYSLPATVATPPKSVYQIALPNK